MHSPRRVVARYIEARVVPFRRDREYAAYHIFLKKMRQLAAKVEAADALLQSSDELSYLLSDAGMQFNTRLYWDSDPLIRSFSRTLQGKKDIPNVSATQEFYEALGQDRMYFRWALEDAQKAMSRRLLSDAAEVDRALKSRDFADNRKYYDEVSDKDLRTLREGVDAALDAGEQVDYLLKRMDRLSDNSMEMGIPESAEMGDVESLYHASVNAKGLYRDGFSDTMPAESSSAGLGGSQSLGLGKGSGISFTEDEYVAKEIARVFKEVAMIARGDLPLSTVMRTVAKHPKQDEIIKWYQTNYMPCGRECSRSATSPTGFVRYVIDEDYAAEVKAGRAEFDKDRLMKTVPVPHAEAYPGPEGIMGLYLSYLNFSGRYDPKFFGVGGPKGLVKRFKGLNPKNIGYIKASVNTAHPEITYGKGEREVRVPPEAVLSVDKFIG